MKENETSVDWAKIGVRPTQDLGRQTVEVPSLGHCAREYPILALLAKIALESFCGRKEVLTEQLV